MILLAVAAAQQRAACGDMQGDVALQLHRADDECSGGNQHRSSAIGGAGVDGCLERSRIDRGLVALGAVAANVVDARAQVVVAWGGLGARTFRRFRIQNSCRDHCARSRQGKLAQPFATRQQCASILLIS